MDTIVFVYGLIIGLSLMILILNLGLAIKGFERSLNLAIIFTGIFVLLYIIINLGIYYSTSLAEMILLSKILITSILLAGISFIIFSKLYASNINQTAITVLIVLALIIIVIAWIRPYGLMYDHLDETIKWDGPWKKEYFDVSPNKSIFQNLLATYSMLYLVFVAYVSFKIYKTGSRLWAFIYGISIYIILVFALLDVYLIQVYEEFAFAALLFLMSARIFAKIISSYELEIAFKQSEEKYKRLFDNSAFGIYQSSMDGRFIMLNPAGKEILGISTDDEIDTINFTNQFYVGSDNRDHFKKVLLQNGSIYNFESQFRKLDGEEIFIREYARLVEDENKRIIIEGAFEDVSDKKQTEKLLIDAKEKAEKSNKLKSEFLAQMSHEIRTPINNILSFTSLLKIDWEEKYFEDTDQYFSIISGASKRIIRTVDLILNMSEIQSSTYEPVFTVINIDDEILDKLFNEYKSEADNKNLEFTFIPLENKVSVLIDQYTVTQIFSNLIDNAIKYTEKGFIKVWSEDYDKTVSVIVEDSGIGISEEYRKTIFEPFSQEQQGYTRKYEGNGLGLALVDKYCELNKASIEFESEVGVGSKFIVSFKKV